MLIPSHPHPIPSYPIHLSAMHLDRLIFHTPVRIALQVPLGWENAPYLTLHALTDACMT